MYQFLHTDALVYAFFLVGWLGVSPVLAQQIAVDSLEKELAQNPSDTAQIDLLIKLSQAYRRVQPDSSIATGERAQTMARQKKQTRRVIEAQLATANGYRTKGEYEQALRLFSAVLADARQLGDSVLVGSALNGTGIVYSMQSRLPLALEYLQQALALRTALNDSVQLIYTLNTLGIVYLDMDDYARALSHFTQALKTAYDKSLLSLTSMLLNNVGLVYEEQGEYERALTYYQQSLDVDRQTGAWVNVGIGLENVGTTYQLLGDTANAFQHFQEGLYYTRMTNNSVIEAKLLYFIGDIYTSQHQYDSAQYYLERSLRLSESYQHPRSQIYAHYGLAKLYYQLEQYPAAQQYITQALTLAQGAGQLGEMELAATLLHRVHAAQGHYTLAYQAQQLMQQYNDSLRTIEEEEKISQAMLVQERLDYEQLRYQHQLQQTALALRDTKLARQRTIGWVMALGVLLSLILAVLFFLGRRKLLRTNRLLTTQKQQIEKQREEIQQQASKLQDANTMISGMNNRLQTTVEQRTEELLARNRQLEEFAFINAHRLRAPIARVLGIANLLEMGQSEQDTHWMLGVIRQETENLDQVVRNINEVIHQQFPSQDF